MIVKVESGRDLRGKMIEKLAFEEGSVCEYIIIRGKFSSHLFKPNVITLVIKIIICIK